MHQNNVPLVSVVMPVYNGERYLTEAIESILTQQYSNFELLILDNGSTDSTPDLLARFARVDSRIRLLHEPKPFGYGGEVASNVAARQAKGAFIAKLDADDVAMPDRLIKQVNYLISNPDVFLVGSQLILIDETGQVTGKRDYPVTHEEIYSQFYLKFPIANPAVMFRNILKEDMYQIKFPHFNDYYSLFRLIHTGYRMHNLPEALTAYRIHTTNTVFTNLRAKWSSNVMIKQAFVREFGYSAPWIHRLKIAAITQVINLFPERMLLKIMNKARQLINA
ncbi:glycosyltransferase [Spirosoma sp. BT702]|uniref:Glycosyltransferase n=1 Tax=Spirosoma profusum TaxID=2771354 RepID=A0A926XTU1_9BACT|nr:glycosyltransferase [Spirosoma profusum]MBD2699759.1 glycosyltransferase [Spirosoma profusum]